MLFTKEHLLDLLDEDPIQEKIVDQRRWTTVYKRVFKYEDKFYVTTYESGSTEQQDTQPYEYDPDEIECDEVKPVEKTVIVYEKVK